MAEQTDLPDDDVDRTAGEIRATEALEASGIAFTIIRHGQVGSLDEAAQAAGVEATHMLKTLVVRRSDDEFLFVLLPGDQQISWPKLRAVLGVTRLSMPAAETARDVTGYERGTITPFGSTTSWPVIADDKVVSRGGQVRIGAGAHGVGALVAAADLVQALFAQISDVTDPL